MTVNEAESISGERRTGLSLARLAHYDHLACRPLLIGTVFNQVVSLTNRVSFAARISHVVRLLEVIDLLGAHAVVRRTWCGKCITSERHPQ
jgi:hypothetical protein